MVLKRFAAVEHLVEGEGTLTAARADGTGGGHLTLTFFPAPGTAYVRTKIDNLLTSTPPAPAGSPHGPGLPTKPRLAQTGPILAGLGDPADRRRAVALARPPIPRPRIPLGPGDVIDDDLPELPTPPPAPERVRLEVGRRGGRMRPIELRPGSFTVPGVFGSREPFDESQDDALTTLGPASKPVATDVVRGGGGRVAGAAAPTPVQAWECRIINISPRDIKVFARVHFTARRTVTISRIPINRLTAVFEGALRGITPKISVSDGDIVVGLPQEIAEEFDIASRPVSLGIVEAREARFDIMPVDFRVIRTETMYREPFTTLKKNLSPFASIPTAFVDTMVAAALNDSRVNLLAKATSLIKPRTAGPFPVNLAGMIRATFESLDIPKTTAGLPGQSVFVRHGDDLALRVLLTVDRLSLKGEAAIASFQLLIDNLTASLDVQIGNQRRFVKHPTLPLPPDDPNADRHHGEWTTTTDLTFTSRFMFAVKDLDADVNVPVLGRTANFFLNWVIDELEWLFEDKFEETVRDTVREFLATNSNDIATKVRQTLLELAEREHELHTVSRDGRDLIIEHYDAFDTPPRPASLRPPRSPRPLAVPIDGPMPDHADARLATVDHIVVVMMENRSFDHMLGWLSHPVHFSGILRHDINGLTGKERVPLGGSVGGTPKTPSFNPQKEMRPDPDHSFTTTAQQIGDGSMDGFIPAYRQRIKDAPEILDFRLEDERRIVECQTAKEVPVYDYIAREYCVLDRWFASFPGPTFVNRMCEIAGLTTSETNTGLRPDLGYLSSLTFFELLDKARVPWRVYEGDVSFLRTFDRYRLEFDKIRPLKEFLDGGDAGLGPVTFLDPNVTGMPSADHAEDDHPATDVQWGQLFLQKVIERLQASVSWKKTMLIITYDEHGGFYDHLAPPGTARFHRANPDVSEDIPRVHEKEGKYGVRVPALVVSPHVKRMSVGHHIYDHTTIARTILQRFAPNQVGFMPERVRRARHLGELLQTKPRLDKPKPPRVPPPNPVRVRVNKFLPNVDLARLKPDPEDARVFLARIGAPSRAPE